MDEKELLGDGCLPQPIRATPLRTTPISTIRDRLPVRRVDDPGKFPRGGVRKTLGMIAVVGVLFLASWADVAGGFFPSDAWEEGPPQDEAEQAHSENPKRKGVITSLYLSLAGVKIGRTMLSEVIERMGSGEIYKQHESDHDSDFVCYVSERDDTVVLFESNYLKEDMVTAIWVGRIEFLRGKGKCAKLEWVDREKARINGISLELGFAKVEKFLGLPTYRDAQYVSYDYEYKGVLPLDGEDREVWIDSGISFYFEEDQINWYSIYKILQF